MNFREKIAGLLANFSSYSRRRRMKFFLRQFPITRSTKILDVGGVPSFWGELPVQPFLVLLNTDSTRCELAGFPVALIGDGRSLPFADGSFDLVVSNSVIEHVGSPESQLQFANEVARVGRSYWVQTPNRWFPIEQHLLIPFIHWLPRAWQRTLVPWCTIWSPLMGFPESHRRFYVEHYLSDIRLLSATELSNRFPSASVLRERLLGLTKSLIVFRDNTHAATGMGKRRDVTALLPVLVERARLLPRPFGDRR